MLRVRLGKGWREGVRGGDLSAKSLNERGSTPDASLCMLRGGRRGMGGDLCCGTLSNICLAAG